MKQMIFTPEFAERLKYHIEDNLSHYLDPTFSWRKEAERCEGIYETDIEQPDLTGMIAYADSKTSADDFEAGKILFEAFKDLTPMQAAQSHVTAQEIVLGWCSTGFHYCRCYQGWI